MRAVREPTIEQGHLTEAPTRDASGMERRAYGEFVSGRGELASYAIGWTTGVDEEDHVGRLTVGIGAGNEGGGTFHAVVFAEDDSHAFSLVDEPFADVPEGGPHLTREQALAHEDLAFIWFVADTVFDQDRRAWWLLHWLHETAVIQTPEVSSGAEPVVFVVHDEDDAEWPHWQLIGTTDPGEEGDIAHLYHALDRDPTICEVLDLPPGLSAMREGPEEPWVREPAAER